MWSHLSQPDAMARNRFLGPTTVFVVNTRRTNRTRPAGHDRRIPAPPGCSACWTPQSFDVGDR